MKLLLDEDSQASIFVEMLTASGHDAMTVKAAGIAGHPDADVLEYALKSGRVILTRNVQDFKALHRTNPNHFGILLEHQDEDRTKNMSYEQVISAIAKIEASGWDIRSQIVDLNAWR